MVRVVEPAQAQMMSGFVIWHVIGHQRSFAKHLAQQRDKIWQRFRSVPQPPCPSAFSAMARWAAASRPIWFGSAFLFAPGAAMRSRCRTGILGYHGTDGLKAMLGETEVLINLLPLTHETRGLLDGNLFARMKRGGYLVQVGRGEHLSNPTCSPHSTTANSPAHRWMYS